MSNIPAEGNYRSNEHLEESQDKVIDAVENQFGMQALASIQVVHGILKNGQPACLLTGLNKQLCPEHNEVHKGHGAINQIAAQEMIYEILKWYEENYDEPYKPFDGCDHD